MPQSRRSNPLSQFSCLTAVQLLLRCVPRYVAVEPRIRQLLFRRVRKKQALVYYSCEDKYSHTHMTLHLIQVVCSSCDLLREPKHLRIWVRLEVREGTRSICDGAPHRSVAGFMENCRESCVQLHVTMLPLDRVFVMLTRAPTSLILAISFLLVSRENELQQGTVLEICRNRTVAFSLIFDETSKAFLALRSSRIGPTHQGGD